MPAAAPAAEVATTPAAPPAPPAPPAKVTRLSTTNAADAHATFVLELQRPAVLLVVRGDDDDARLAVERGAQLAGTAARPRWVVWAPLPELIAPDLAALENDTSDDVERALLLSLAFDRHVRFVLPHGQEPSEGRIFKAFTRAEV